MPSGASRTQLVIVAAVIVLSAVLAKTHALHRLTHHDRAAATASPAPTGRSGTTTTTLTSLVMRDYRVGDCVTWDQEFSDGAASAEVVPCARPHLVEMTGRARVKDSGPFPGEAYFRNVQATTCVSEARAVLGHPLDLSGRYAPFVLVPQKVSWQIGKRAVWCGLMSGASPKGRFSPMTGDARGTDQSLNLPPGTCIVLHSKRATVPCTAAHDALIVGRLDLRGRSDSLPTAGQWSALVDSDCVPSARALLGHDPAPPAKVQVLTLDPQSWAAGTRSTECVVVTSG